MHPIIGKIITKISIEKTNYPTENEVAYFFTCSDGAEFRMGFSDDEFRLAGPPDVIGNLNYLIGSKVKEFTEIKTERQPVGQYPSACPARTWSIFTFKTISQYLNFEEELVFVWLGESIDSRLKDCTIANFSLIN